MSVLKEIRESRGVSQRHLAATSGLSFGCVQRLEQAEHNWRVGSLRRVTRALNLPAGGLDLFIERYLTVVPDSVEDVSLRIHGGGFDSWKTHCFNFVDRFRSGPDAGLTRHPPVHELDVRLRALIASIVEALCAETGLRAPDWCRGIPGLETPWFVSGVENLKAMALVESPAQFRKRNIFVLGNFLNRA